MFRCPSCKKIMRDTGKKRIEHRDINNKLMYEGEYRCPRCKSYWTYSEKGNVL